MVNLPGCPPIADVLAGTIVHLVTFDRLPELDALHRPKVFYGQRIHDQCYRRAFFDAGMFVEKFDDEGARKGWCLYKVGCRGPVTSNACAVVKWNDGVSYPIQSGHPCLGCSEPDYWDHRPMYEHITTPSLPGVPTAEKIGKTLAIVTAAAAGDPSDRFRDSQSDPQGCPLRPEARTAAGDLSHGQENRRRSHYPD